MGGGHNQLTNATSDFAAAGDSNTQLERGEDGTEARTELGKCSATGEAVEGITYSEGTESPRGFRNKNGPNAQEKRRRV